MLSVAALVVVGADTGMAGDITGTVTLTKPNGKPLRDSMDIAVYLEPVRTPGPARRRTASRKPGRPATSPATSPETSQRPTDVMASRNKTFVPGTLVVETGTIVTFPNRDSIYHNVFSPSRKDRFDLGLYRSYKNEKSSETHTFNKPGIYDIFCNIHERMHGVIHVVRTPYFTLTDKDGRYVIRDAPPGAYILKAEHRRAQRPEAGRVTITDGVVTQNLSLKASLPKRVEHTRKDGSSYPMGSLY